MRRLLLLLLGLVVAVLWFRRRLRRPGAPGPGGGRMVRDRICNTYVPQERALRLTDAEGEHFFCSEACRREHVHGPAAPVN